MSHLVDVSAPAPRALIQLDPTPAQRGAAEGAVVGLLGGGLAVGAQALSSAALWLFPLSVPLAAGGVSVAGLHLYLQGAASVLAQLPPVASLLAVPIACLGLWLSLRSLSPHLAPEARSTRLGVLCATQLTLWTAALAGGLVSVGGFALAMVVAGILIRGPSLRRFPTAILRTGGALVAVFTVATAAELSVLAFGPLRSLGTAIPFLRQGMMTLDPTLVAELLFLPWARSGCSRLLAVMAFLAALAPVTAWAAARLRRLAPRASPLTVAAVACVPVLFLGQALLQSVLRIGELLREVAAYTPVAEIRAALALALVGGVLLPHALLALWAAARARPLLPALEGPGQGDRVGVLELAADRQAVGDAGDLQALLLE